MLPSHPRRVRTRQSARPRDHLRRRPGRDGLAKDADGAAAPVARDTCPAAAAASACSASILATSSRSSATDPTSKAAAASTPASYLACCTSVDFAVELVIRARTGASSGQKYTSAQPGGDPVAGAGGAASGGARASRAARLSSRKQGPPAATASSTNGAPGSALSAAHPISSFSRSSLTTRTAAEPSAKRRSAGMSSSDTRKGTMPPLGAAGAAEDAAAASASSSAARAARIFSASVMSSRLPCSRLRHAANAEAEASLESDARKPPASSVTCLASSSRTCCSELANRSLRRTAASSGTNSTEDQAVGDSRSSQILGAEPSAHSGAIDAA
mmetsp:Transcript_23277/g.88192  ORF Transcript_23277/g.88192 Transcript_23277/m.88192 type:complete len:330 (-) Transcript_23277:217-1206(-)